MPQLVLANNHAGALAALDGETIGIAAMTSAYIPTAADDTIDTLTGEVDDGDAPGYVRATTEATWNPTTRRLTIDQSPPPAFDLEGEADVRALVFFWDDDDTVISAIRFDAPITGADAMDVIVDAIAGLELGSTIAADLTALGARVTALEALPAFPDPSAQPDGQVPTTLSGAYVFAEGGGGGGGDPDAPTVWQTTASYYVHEDRVYLGGAISHDTSGGGFSESIADADAYPESTRVIATTVGNDMGGTPNAKFATINIGSGGSVSIAAALPGDSFTGTIVAILEGLSYRIADPA